MRLGIPDSNIILMLVENMACNPRNMFPRWCVAMRIGGWTSTRTGQMEELAIVVVVAMVGDRAQTQTRADWELTVNVPSGQISFGVYEGHESVRTPHMRMRVMEEAQHLLCTIRRQSSALGVDEALYEPFED
ncbi:hypothetical protein PPACK8108_LOCUS3384 [Phakopsora pachyrhizi]|uniref:Uncharacterized protein n=1 Tax=Phakopsora pachyrhizi TaxID=170000 RepID=A0AAV0AJX8_PHAPC|nr:hypothetical protein PPACK8108_LOCUS3384 [Phakopsora pachyrhizi]